MGYKVHVNPAKKVSQGNVEAANLDRPPSPSLIWHANICVLAEVPHAVSYFGKFCRCYAVAISLLCYAIRCYGTI